MEIQSVKRWHWVVIGALAGSGLGWGQLALRQEQRVGGEGFINQEVFERELALPPVGGRARFKDIVIYSVGDADVVQMQRLVRLDGEWVYDQCRFAAPRPYQALGRPGSGRAAVPVPVPGGYTVRDYMRDAVQHDPHIALDYSWWGFPAAVMGIWTVGTMAAIGGVWPTVLGFLVGAGLGRSEPEKPMLDLDRFKGEAEPTAEGPTEADALRLRELEEAMLLGLAEKRGEPATAEAADETTDIAPPVPELKPAVDEPSLAANEEDPKDYQGEFYPVARVHVGPGTGRESGHHGPSARGA